MTHKSPCSYSRASMWVIGVMLVIIGFLVEGVANASSKAAEAINKVEKQEVDSGWTKEALTRIERKVDRLIEGKK